MKAKLGLTALVLSVLFWTPGGPVVPAATSRLAPLESPLLQPASVTESPEAPVVVPTQADLNDRGFSTTPAVATTPDLTDDVLAAYTLAVATSPLQCHITTPMLAAIGQVESGNLAGHTLDASHRVVPGILGPVLDGKSYRAVPDTDGGTWDGNKSWDRALGPMQIIPASWRVVGVDMDGDGVRDPQDIYDAAGAAMVYLCAGGRDLSTAAGLKQAILSYNDSPAYLRAVLGWKTVFDNADLTGMGAVPFTAALSMSPEPVSTHVSEPTPTPRPPVSARPSAPASSAALDPTRPADTATKPSAPAVSTPATPATPTTPADPSPSTPTPDPQPSTPADPTPSDPTPADPTPTDPPELPVCPVPTDDPTADPSADPSATPGDGATTAPDPDEPVVSPETCTAPDGYQFDEETGELVPIPVVTPTP